MQGIWTPIIAGVMVFAFSSSASAGLIIQRNFTGGVAPGNTAGGGNLSDIFDAAADWWELAFPDPNGEGSDFAVAIDFGWGPRGGALLATHWLVNQAGVPNRETEALITFDNDGSSVFFLDLTPHDNSEYQTFTEFQQDLGGGFINTGRVFSNPTGAAVGRYDALSVAKHEIGHVLGMSADNFSYQTETTDSDIDVTASLPFTGTVIPILGSHIDLPNALMFPSIVTDIRRVQSEVDILANAQISQFQNPVLDPQHAVVPEPSSFVLLGLGMAGLGLYRRRERHAQPAA